MAGHDTDVQLGVPISLYGVAQKWELNPTVRSRVRASRRLFVCSTEGNHEPVCHVEEAALNVDVLFPVIECMGRYRSGDGKIQLFTIAQAEEQIPE